MNKPGISLSAVQKRAVALLFAGLLAVLLLLANYRGADRFSYSAFGKAFTASGGVSSAEVGEWDVQTVTAAQEPAYLTISELVIEEGEYQLTLEYSLSGSDAQLILQSPNALNADNSGGYLYVDQPVTSQAESLSVSFSVPAYRPDLELRLVVPAGASFTLSHLDISGVSPAIRDTPLFMLLAVLVFLLLLWAACTPRRLAAPAVVCGQAISGRRLWFMLFFGFSALALFLTAPLLGSSIPGGCDLPYHLARIQGLADSLRCGQFPVRIHAGLLNDYGYPNSLFYPDLLLYLPAALRVAGMSLAHCYAVFFALSNLATSVLAYLCFARLLHSRPAALAAAVVYTVNPYRLLCLFERGAVGEYTAMIFLPLVVYGLYAIFWGDRRDWFWLTAGMLGIAQCHILTTVMTAVFCALTALPALPRIFGKEKRIWPLLRAAVLTVLLDAWQLIPMLCMTMQYTFRVFTRSAVLVGTTSLQTLLDFPSLKGTSMSIGLAVLLCGAAMALYLLARPLPALPEEKRLYRIGRVLLAEGFLAFLAITPWFPWARIQQLSLLRRLFGAMQFATRFSTIGMVLIAAAGGVALALWLRRASHRQAAAAALCTVALIEAALVLNGVPLYADYDMGTVDELPVHTTSLACIGQGEYLLDGVSVADMLFVPPGIVSSGPALTISNLTRNGTSLSFDYTTTDDVTGQYLLLPLSYFPTYVAEVDGVAYTTQSDGNYLVRMELPAQQGHVEVYYRSPTLFRLAEALTLLTVLGLLLRRPLGRAWRRLAPSPQRRLSHDH